MASISLTLIIRLSIIEVMIRFTIKLLVRMQIMRISRYRQW